MATNQLPIEKDSRNRKLMVFVILALLLAIGVFVRFDHSVQEQQEADHHRETFQTQ